jgi:hypothetical protein
VLHGQARARSTRWRRLLPVNVTRHPSCDVLPLCNSACVCHQSMGPEAYDGFRSLCLLTVFVAPPAGRACALGEPVSNAYRGAPLFPVVSRLCPSLSSCAASPYACSAAPAPAWIVAWTQLFTVLRVCPARIWSISWPMTTSGCLSVCSRRKYRSRLLSPSLPVC